MKLLPLVFVLLLTLISNFPLAVPRYWVATCGIAIGIAAFGHDLYRRPYLFRILLTAVIVVVFPLLSLTRYPVAVIRDRFHSLKAIFHLSFAYGDFDAYTSFCSTIAYVQRFGTTGGKQLLTVLCSLCRVRYGRKKGSAAERWSINCRDRILRISVVLCLQKVTLISGCPGPYCLSL